MQRNHRVRLTVDQTYREKNDTFEQYTTNRPSAGDLDTLGVPKAHGLPVGFLYAVTPRPGVTLLAAHFGPLLIYGERARARAREERERDRGRMYG